MGFICHSRSKEEGSTDNGHDIVIKDLVKHNDDVKAANRLNLGIKKGERFGFLGPNGAGKTTTSSMLCGLLEPTADLPMATVSGRYVTQIICKEDKRQFVTTVP